MLYRVIPQTMWSHVSFYDTESEDSQGTLNVILRRVSVTIAAVEKQ
jgi:hypothetical protein